MIPWSALACLSLQRFLAKSNFSVQFYAGGTRLELILFHEFETSRTHDGLFGFVVLEFEKYRCTFARKTELNNAKIYC